ncbi:hypothetical protein GBA63_17070 [Rubrobacter tropicus]|uniref:Uncharacterized protein n=1 Tax=Rubrobacter tropicus TaxID=2653851 RepID=A0A6G8QD33_9ACTN|nr:hypothetical protein [Rubrobacter tropicus]QIN84167.1 hypothetical protein GBA63_17070 [Rubrobacter tropicus]
MDFVDLQRRKQDHARARRKPEASQRSVTRGPLLMLGTGFVLGSSVSYFYSNLLYTPGVSALMLLAATLALACYFGWLLLGRRPGRTGPKIGSEKQLLLAILDREGGITPVEAALETSLTVDEAEDIMTRLADRGHLMVEGRDGALFYTLPGRRPASETGTP